MILRMFFWVAFELIHAHYGPRALIGQKSAFPPAHLCLPVFLHGDAQVAIFFFHVATHVLYLITSWQVELASFLFFASNAHVVILFCGSKFPSFTFSFLAS